MAERTEAEEARLDLIHETAEKAYASFASEHPEFVGNKPGAKKEVRGWKDLSPLEQFGVYSHVAAVQENPYHQGYPQIMRANKSQKEYRALDDAIRDQLGYARVQR